MKMWVAAGLLVASQAFAEAAPAAPGVSQFVPLVLIFGIFYFLIIRPQQKKQKLHTQFLSELKRGDRVVTSSGIIGTIKTLSDAYIQLEIEDGVCLKLLRSHVSESANNLKEETKPKA
jgi:preprotein translocase subunit YajC